MILVNFFAKNIVPNTALECSPEAQLAAEIVAFAIKDWRDLIQRKAWKKEPKHNKNFAELRAFFQSDWCSLLMNGMRITPEGILQILENELQEAMQKDKKRKENKK